MKQYPKGSVRKHVVQQNSDHANNVQGTRQEACLAELCPNNLYWLAHNDSY